MAFCARFHYDYMIFLLRLQYSNCRDQHHADIGQYVTPLFLDLQVFDFLSVLATVQQHSGSVRCSWPSILPMSEYTF